MSRLTLPSGLSKTTLELLENAGVTDGCQIKSIEVIRMLNDKRRNLEDQHGQLIKDLVKLIKRFVQPPITQENLDELTVLNKKVQGEHNKITKHRANLKAISKTNGDVVVAVVWRLNELVRGASFFTKLTPFIEENFSVDADELISNPKQPLAQKRQQLSIQCAGSAKMALMNSLEFEPADFEMFAARLDECVGHYALGVALLDGNPKTIDRVLADGNPDGLNAGIVRFCETFNDQPPAPPKAFKR